MITNVRAFFVLTALLLGSTTATTAGAATAFKSFKPGGVWPDDKGVHINAHGGGFLLHEGVYYWFGEHKIAGAKGNSAQVGVHVYSSRDLYNWKDEGIALRVSEKAGSDIERGCIIERPKVIFNAKTGKFVMWFHLELKGQKYEAARTALAVADKVTGPYKFVKSLRPNAGVWPVNLEESMKGAPGGKARQWQREIIWGKHLKRDFAGGQMARDMTLFVDDDGKAYLICASEENCTLHIAELTEDYQGFTGRWARALPGDQNEAPAVFKRGGKYYMISSGCTGWEPNPARSAVADSIFGPWRPLGNPCRGSAEEVATTFRSQSTFVLPAPGRAREFIYMGDRWVPKNPIDGRYVWLPVEWEKDKPVLRWRREWDLSVFGAAKVKGAGEK